MGRLATGPNNAVVDYMIRGLFEKEQSKIEQIALFLLCMFYVQLTASLFNGWKNNYNFELG